MTSVLEQSVAQNQDFCLEIELFFYLTFGDLCICMYVGSNSSPILEINLVQKFEKTLKIFILLAVQYFAPKVRAC